jgi:hypothetical protein
MLVSKFQMLYYTTMIEINLKLILKLYLNLKSLLVYVVCKYSFINPQFIEFNSGI